MCYKQNMKRLKANKKKLTPLLTTVQTKSRDFIISIFNQQNESDKLQYTKSRWKIPKNEQQSRLVEKKYSYLQEPLKTILPVIQFIANKVDLNISNFIFVDGLNLHIAYRQRTFKFVKVKFQSNKLKYWLSHLYFFRLKQKLATDLLLKKQNTNRQTVHIFQEKQYLPGHLSGFINKFQPLVRKLKVSPQKHYRRQGQAQKKPFCIINGKNGRQQVLNFSEALAFADYKLNLQDIVYIRILNSVDAYDDTSQILISYIQKDEKQYQKQMLEKNKSILNYLEGWQYHKKQIQRQKIQKLQENDFYSYAKFLTLQIVAFIETRHFLPIKKIQIQWTLNQAKDLYLSNVWAFQTVENQPQNKKQGLATLYQKIYTQKNSTTCFKKQISNRQIFKSQQKHRKSTNFSQLPVKSAAKPYLNAYRSQQNYMSKLRSKGKSCILRKG